MSKRRAIPLEKQLAAALCQIGGIAYADALRMTPRQVRSLFALDHYPVPVALGGPDEHYNLQFTFTKPHRDKTAKLDVPSIAKAKRGAKETAAFRARMLAKDGKGETAAKTAPKARGRLGNRAFPRPPPGMKFDWKRGKYARPSP